MIQIDMDIPKDCLACTLRYQAFCMVDGHHEPHLKKEYCPLKEVPTGKGITTKQLEDMYKKYERKLWNEREDVRGDDMVEIGFAEQFLQDGLMELGCWDNDVVEEQQGERKEKR